ncbi:MAG TPA: bifunctional YncE family protein/alkaline phosphatase family protein [Verrucomicrobiota bacterium]|nr:bifunctional YncE family protein/alkaline phosphatase family protein [Verrucomicrobiota bacterium]HNU51392.1 bifunctional YncE family protein/alkaline phosphatase family protein [Verrucomicrobiota bacterium]
MSGARGADPDYGRTTEAVGQSGPQRTVTPVNQIVTPVGVQVELPGMRPQAMALSPDGRILVTSGKTHEIVVIDPATGQIRQRVPLPSDKVNEPPAEAVSSHILEPDTEGQLSYTGLVFSPDGRRLYLANVNGSIKVFGVGPDGAVAGLFSARLPRADAPRRRDEIPSGLAVSADGARLYVAGNLSNRLLELESATGKLLRSWDVGFAPYDVVLVGSKAYVSNWGGRRPEPGSLTGPGGRGTLVRVDPVRHIASEGSVTVIDLAGDRVDREVLAGLHASALAATPDGRHVAVANAGSDTVQVLDTRTDRIIETLWTKPTPADLFGASPNALAFDRTGRTLYVCNGTLNSVAVIRFRPGSSELNGLVPVGWFPAAVVCDARRQALYVANLKGIGRGRPNARTGRTEYNSHQYFGSVSLVPLPDRRALREQTRVVLANARAPLIEQARLPARSGQPPRPVPERVGEPGVFKHVVYIIKENRTYDQVLGDVPEGNGDPSLCVFGEEVTPNQHKMVREFVLLDNTYCSGILSADGHQWSDTAFATDYMEKSFAGFPRSYPDGMEDDDVDALAYAPSGFIWDNALAHGRTLRVYGEFAITMTSWKDPSRLTKLRFLDYYRDFIEQTGAIRIWSRPAIESLRPHLCTNTVGWDMAIPDVFRAAEFIKELKEYEARGTFPNLAIICLPNDHTSGTSAGSPTPAAQVADNDLAFGRIVEALSRSRFWKELCILAIEDDPQAGWDHVSGYRTTAYVISPYSRRRGVVSTQYNQTSILRTIELILGLPPMNVMDASATPMFDCFGEHPDLTPFEAVPNRVPLDQMNPEPRKIADPLLRRHAVASARLPLDEVDRCPEDLLNRILWHAMKGPLAPYPEWAVSKVDDDD